MPYLNMYKIGFHFFRIPAPYCLIGPDPHLVPRVVDAVQEAAGEVVPQFVGKNHARDRSGRQVDKWLNAIWMVRAKPFGPFHGKVAAMGEALRGCSQHRPCERAAAGTGLDNGEPVGTAKALPHRVHPSRQHGSKERSDLGAGDEVSPASGGSSGGVEAVDGAVETCLHVLVEANRSICPDACEQSLCQPVTWRAGNVSLREPGG